MQMLHTLVLLAVATGCGGSPKPVTHHAPPAVVPPDAVALRGPERCADDCGVSSIRTIDAAGIRRVGVVSRGLYASLAVETSSGWFFERAAEPGPMHSHHEPHSRGYDLTKTRVDGNAIVLRLIDAQSVFYPGQGSAGSSHTTWFERRCMVIDGLVRCQAPAQIATERCTRESSGPDAKTSCTGGPPPA